MPWAVFAISVILSVVVEVVAGNYGGLVPCLPICAYYFTMRYGAQRPLLGVVLAGALVDGCWMHHFPSQVLTILAVMGFSSVWRPYGDVNSGLSLAFSGLCIGVISWLIHLLGMVTASDLGNSGIYLIQLLVYQVVISILMALVLALVLNRVLQRSVTWLSAPDDEDNE